jgi:hypothetical protein
MLHVSSPFSEPRSVGHVLLSLSFRSTTDLARGSPLASPARPPPGHGPYAVDDGDGPPTVPPLTPSHPTLFGRKTRVSPSTPTTPSPARRSPWWRSGGGGDARVTASPEVALEAAGLLEVLTRDVGAEQQDYDALLSTRVPDARGGGGGGGGAAATPQAPAARALAQHPSLSRVGSTRGSRRSLLVTPSRADEAAPGGGGGASPGGAGRAANPALSRVASRGSRRSMLVTSTRDLADDGAAAPDGGAASPGGGGGAAHRPLERVASRGSRRSLLASSPLAGPRPASPAAAAGTPLGGRSRRLTESRGAGGSQRALSGGQRTPAAAAAGREGAAEAAEAAEAAAATRIQALERGRVVRARRSAEAAAVTRIQAISRGRAVRVDAASRAEAASHIQVCARVLC